MSLSLAIIVVCLCCSGWFAADNSNVNLGDQITDSLDKTGDSIRNVTSDVMDAGANTMRSMGNTIDGDNNNNTTTNRNNHTNNGNNNNNDNRMSQRNLSNGTNYNAVRTSVDEATTNGTMSTTTWIWIILAVAAIVIVAMIWYYAVKTDNE